MALFKQTNEYSVEDALPPFIAKVHALLDLPENKDSINWAGQNNIHIKNPSRLEKIVLPKMFAGLTVDRFLERMEKYGYIRDKSWFQEGIMLRLRIVQKKASTTKKENMEYSALTNGRTHSQNGAPYSFSNETKHEPNLLEPMVNSAGASQEQMKELEEYRSIVCQKIFAIQDELKSIKQRHPDKATELTNMLKYTNSMLKIGSEVVPPTKK